MAAEPETEVEDDRPELLRKLEERKERHAERGMFARVGVVVLGRTPGVARHLHVRPGHPRSGIVVILLGLSFLALEFDRAERLLAKAIVWADNAKDRAEAASPRQKALTGALGGAGGGGLRGRRGAVGHPLAARDLIARQDAAQRIHAAVVERPAALADISASASSCDQAAR